MSRGPKFTRVYSLHTLLEELLFLKEFDTQVKFCIFWTRQFLLYVFSDGSYFDNIYTSEHKYTLHYIHDCTLISSFTESQNHFLGPLREKKIIKERKIQE